jgi:hypothetical protein
VAVVAFLISQSVPPDVKSQPRATTATMMMGHFNPLRSMIVPPYNEA